MNFLPRLGNDDAEATHWPVFSDVALSMFFIILLYLVVQFFDLDKLVAIQRVQERQAEVDSLLHAEVPKQYKPDVTVTTLDPYRQKLTFSADVLFPICEASLTTRGRDLLVAVGKALGSRAGYFEAVQIEGHTDKTPIGGQRDCPYASNWELSSQRATTVVRLLIDRGDLRPATLSAIGRAEFHPVPGAEGNDLASLARNRRIEVTLQYSDAVTTDSSAALNDQRP